MKYSKAMEIVEQMMKGWEKDKKDIRSVEGYFYILAKLCITVEKQNLNEDEEIRLLKKRFQSRYKDIKKYSEELQADIFERGKKLTPVKIYLEEAEKKVVSMQKTELDACVFFDVVMEMQEKMKERRMHFRLHVYEKQKKISVINLIGTSGYVFMGRDKQNGIQVKHLMVPAFSNHLYILKNQLILARRNGKIYVNDQKLGLVEQEGGSYDLNGKAYVDASMVQLQNGDCFSLGNYLDFYVEVIGESKGQSEKNRPLVPVKLSFLDNEKIYGKNDIEVNVEQIGENGRIFAENMVKIPEEEKKQAENQIPKKQEAPVFQPGDVIPGYKGIKLLGRGGCGEVYLVEERSTGKRFAVKKILKQNMIYQKYVEYFLREAKMHGQLDHKYVAEVYGMGVFNGELFIIMKYYEHGTLADYVAQIQNKSKKYAFIKDLYIQLLTGLDYFHNAEVVAELEDGSQVKVKGMVHRDLKLENVFIDYDQKGNWEIKIADFGMAKAYEIAGQSGMTQTGDHAGTLPYMCRQQLFDYKNSKPEVDIWAATAMIYVLLTNEFPRPIPVGVPPELQMLALAQANPVPIRMYNPQVPEALAKIIDRALDDNRDDLYYQKASDLIKDLRKVKC